MPSYINLLHDEDFVHSIINKYNAILQNNIREFATPTNLMTNFFSATLYEYLEGFTGQPLTPLNRPTKKIVILIIP